MPQAETQEAPVSKTYYSTPKAGSALTFWIWGKPKWLAGDDGRGHIEEGPVVQFMPQSDGYGRYTSDDPEIIAAIEKRRKTDKEILTPEEYIQAITPVEKLMEANERTIERQNELIKKLRADLAERERQQGGASSVRK